MRHVVLGRVRADRALVRGRAHTRRRVRAVLVESLQCSLQPLLETNVGAVHPRALHRGLLRDVLLRALRRGRDATVGRVAGVVDGCLGGGLQIAERLLAGRLELLVGDGRGMGERWGARVDA